LAQALSSERVHNPHSTSTHPRKPYRTNRTPKGSPRYGTAPTGTFGIGPVGPAVSRGTGHKCLCRRHFCPAVPFARIARYGFQATPKPEILPPPTVPLQICMKYALYRERLV
jgi:hypothetical protein